MCDRVLPPLRDALATGRAAFQALDLEALDAAAGRELTQLGERLERLGRCLKLGGLAAVARTDAWQGDGDRSLADWTARTTGSTKQEAKRAVDTAAQLSDLPDTAAALANGEVSGTQAEAIAGAAAADPSAESDLIGAAKRSSVQDLRNRCRDTRSKADPDPEATARRIHQQRSCRTWTDPDGVAHLHLSGPGATIARMASAVRHRADRLFRDAHRTGQHVPSEAYQLDAAEQLLCADGAGTPIPRGADAKIIFRIDFAAFLRGRAIDGEVCEIAGFGPVPVSVVREWMGEAFLAAVVTKGTDVTTVVHLGRRFTALQRTALQWQDPCCARRGCGNSLGLEYDHRDDWARTRTTRTTSAERFCRADHRLKSQGWEVGPPDAEGKVELIPPHDPRHSAFRARPDAPPSSDDVAAAARAAVEARRARVRAVAQ